MIFKENNVIFNNVKKPGLYTGGPILSRGSYTLKDNESNEIKASNQFMNAIDIHWNDAYVEGVINPIRYTSQLIELIANNVLAINETNERINNFENSIGNYDNLVERIQELENENNTLNERIENLYEIIDSHNRTYNITYNLINVNKVNCPNEVQKNNNITLTFSPAVGYIMPNDISVTGAEYEYLDNSVTLSNVTNDVIITINAIDKIQYVFNIPSINHLNCILLEDNNSFEINDLFRIQLSVDNNELYELPDIINPINCRLLNYNNETGIAELKCKGTGNMSINCNVNTKEVEPTGQTEPIIPTGETEPIEPTGESTDIIYYFAAISEEMNDVVTLANETINSVDMSAVIERPECIQANGVCPIDFVNGYEITEDIYYAETPVWYIIPSIFFNETTFELTDGTNMYRMYYRNPNLGQYLTESLKQIQYISYNNIDYTLICVGREGIGYPQMFEKIN